MDKEQEYFTVVENHHIYAVKKLENNRFSVLHIDHNGKPLGIPVPNQGVLVYDEKGKIWYYENCTISDEDRLPIADRVAKMVNRQ